MLLSCEYCEGTDSMFSLLILLEIINETAGKGQLMVIIKKVMRYYITFCSYWRRHWNRTNSNYSNIC